MSIATYLVCDSCGAEAHRAGVGKDNVGYVTLDYHMELSTDKEKQYKGCELCCDCQQKLVDFIKGMGL